MEHPDTATFWTFHISQNVKIGKLISWNISTESAALRLAQWEKREHLCNFAKFHQDREREETRREGPLGQMAAEALGAMAQQAELLLDVHH